jgi:hypothetical protein
MSFTKNLTKDEYTRLFNEYLINKHSIINGKHKCFYRDKKQVLKSVNEDPIIEESVNIIKKSSTKGGCSEWQLKLPKYKLFIEGENEKDDLRWEKSNKMEEHTDKLIEYISEYSELEMDSTNNTTYAQSVKNRMDLEKKLLNLLDRKETERSRFVWVSRARASTSNL